MTGVFLQVPAGPVVRPLALLAAVAGVVVLVRGGRATARRVLTVLVMAGYGAAVITLTYFPLEIRTGDHANRVSWLDEANLIPVLTIDAPTLASNVLMFAPFGALLPLWRRCTRWTDAARWGLAVSAVIEAGQWVTDVAVSSGRTADVNDLIANTAGAALGFWALRVSTRPESNTKVVETWAVVRVRPVGDARDDGVAFRARCIQANGHLEGPDSGQVPDHPTNRIRRSRSAPLRSTPLPATTIVGGGDQYRAHSVPAGVPRRRRDCRPPR